MGPGGMDAAPRPRGPVWAPFVPRALLTLLGSHYLHPYGLGFLPPAIDGDQSLSPTTALDTGVRLCVRACV